MWIIGDKLNKERDKQLAIIHKERPSADNHLCEKGIFQKLCSLLQSCGLYNKVYLEYERLYEKYDSEFEIDEKGTCHWNDNVDYIKNNRESN